MRLLCFLPVATLLASACNRLAPTSVIPDGQAAVVARIEATSPTIAPPRRGGYLMPQETGRQIRAQAGRPPLPGTDINPPPPSS